MYKLSITNVQTKVPGLCTPGLEAWSLEPINAHPVMGIWYSVGLATKVPGLCAPGLEAWSLEPINAHPVMGIWYSVGLCAPGLEAWLMQATKRVFRGVFCSIWLD